MKATTGEIIVGTKNGVWKTRSVRRRPLEERWAAESADMIGGVPWRVNDDDPNVDGEKLECEATEPKAEVWEVEEKGWLDEERVPRVSASKARTSSDTDTQKGVLGV